VVASLDDLICILGAVFVDGVIVQSLTNFMWIDLEDESKFLRLARVFYALSRNLHKLRDYYNDLEDPSRIITLGSRYFPSIAAYCENGQTIKFEYVGYLEKSMACATLRARTCTEPSRDIVIKLVNSYGEQAHRLLQGSGLAPKLLYYGTPRYEDGQPSYQNLFMVVMEYVDGQTLFEAGVSVDREMVKHEVNQAIRLLHDSGIVLGSLRATNVMITKTNQVKLVNCNCAGTHGQARYPFPISSEADLPAGASPYSIIKMSHDLAMLERLFS